MDLAGTKDEEEKKPIRLAQPTSKHFLGGPLRGALGNHQTSDLNQKDRIADRELTRKESPPLPIERRPPWIHQPHSEGVRVCVWLCQVGFPLKSDKQKDEPHILINDALNHLFQNLAPAKAEGTQNAGSPARGSPKKTTNQNMAPGIMRESEQFLFGPGGFP